MCSLACNQPPLCYNTLQYRNINLQPKGTLDPNNFPRTGSCSAQQVWFSNPKEACVDELDWAVLSTTTDACQITSTIGSTVRATAVAAVSAMTAGAAATTNRLPNAAAAPPKCVTVTRDLLHHRPLPVIATKASNTGIHTYPRPPSIMSIDLLLEIFAAAAGDEKLIKT